MQIYIQSEGEPVNSSEGRLNPMIIADIEGLKFDLLILQKKVEINTGLLSRLNRQSQDDLAADAELHKYKLKRGVINCCH